MNNKNIVKLAESILYMLNNKEKGAGGDFTTLSDCVLGMVIMQAAYKEIEENIIKCLETMNDMAKEGLITRGVHYHSAVDSEGDYVLRINYSNFYDRFLDYYKQRNIEHSVFTLSEFKLLLRTQRFCKHHNKPAWFEERSGSYCHRKSHRCAVLKVYDLKAMAVDINFMLEE